MIEHADVDQGQRLAQPLRDVQVGVARLRHAGRVIVGEQDAGGVAGDRFAYDFAWVHCGLG